MHTDPLLRNQYADASNLNARSSLHGRFRTNRYGWLRWVFDHFDWPAQCRVLELGCGNGALWATNAARILPGWDITLTDASAGMLDDARRDLAQLQRPTAFDVVDIHSIPYGGGRFDAVIANHMLYHVGDLPAGLREVRRVLKPAGRLFATTNGTDHMRELRDLVQLLAPNLPFARGETSEAFGLENGPSLLAPFFADIRVDRYDDLLEVTETQPLVAYVLSVRGAQETLTDIHVAELRRQIDARIAAHGAFHITKSQGIIQATRG